jgi:hypothetical protein
MDAGIKAAGGFCLSSKFRHSNTRNVRFSANDVCLAPDSRPWRTVIGTGAFDPKQKFGQVGERSKANA